MFFEHRDGELAVTEVALVAAVGEARGQLSQVTFADWLAAQRAESLWTGPPAVHQYEFHMRSPGYMKPRPSGPTRALTREPLNRTEVDAAGPLVLATHTRVCCSPYLRCPAHTLVAM